MKLSEILAKYNIELRDENGFLKNSIDLLEEMYLRMSPEDASNFMKDIFDEETREFPFDEEREKGTL